MRREDIRKSGEYNRPRETRDLSALQAIGLVEVLLDALPDLNINERDYHRLVNSYARHLRAHTTQLEHRLLHDWSGQ